MNKWILILLAGGLLAAAKTSDADVVVIVNRAAELPTKEQVSDVYLGRSRTFTPIDRSETSSLRAEFYRKATGRDTAQIKMVWARLVFTGRGLPHGSCGVRTPSRRPWPPIRKRSAISRRPTWMRR